MKSRKGPITLIVSGSLLALGPLWGLLGTMIGMFRTFGTVATSGPGTSEQLANDVSTSFWATVAGLIISPIGIVLLVVGIVWLVRIRKAEKGIEPGVGR